MKNSFSILFLVSLLTVICQGNLTKNASKKECSVVSIAVKTNKGLQSLKGVIIDRDGYILTTAQSLRTADNIVITFQDGFVSFASVYAAYNMSDVALLKVNELPYEACVASLGDSDRIAIGDKVILSTVNAELRIVTIAEKVVEPSVINNYPKIEYFILTNPVDDVTRGAPVFDTKGKVIGVISDTLSHSSNIAAVTSGLAKRVLEDEHSFWIGIETSLVTQKEQPSMQQLAGLRIDQMSPKSPFTHDGFRVGDIVLKIGDIEVDEINDIEILYKYFLSEDGIVKLKILRNGRFLEIEVDLNG
jgi:S1-C subfamily serine protease